MASADKTKLDGVMTMPDTGMAEMTFPDGATVFNGSGTAGGAETDVATGIAKGSVLLGTYRAESDAIEEGGMGQVWRVRHTGWNVDLALKRPRAEWFQKEEQKKKPLPKYSWVKVRLWQCPFSIKSFHFSMLRHRD